MVKYLKKSKIRKLLLSLGYPVPALKDCSYKFYRGSEWFDFQLPESNFALNFYFCKGYMSVEKIQTFDDELDDFCNRLVSRSVISGAEYRELISSLA